MDCEILIGDRESTKSFRVLRALEEHAPFPVKVTTSYSGNCELLMMWGVGRDGHWQARDQQVAAGGHCAMWDMGYFQAGMEHYFRVSLDHQHPQAWLERTPSDPSRWDALGLKLEELSKPEGHVLVIGMGHKSHRFLGTEGWEQRAVKEARRTWHDRRVQLRPKPNKSSMAKPIRADMQGASLVVCRHSNCAVQAAMWGIPFTCEDGAAMWLQDKDFTRENRLDFLQRLAWWQWKTSEFRDAWSFLINVTARSE